MELRGKVVRRVWVRFDDFVRTLVVVSGAGTHSTVALKIARHYRAIIG